MATYFLARIDFFWQEFSKKFCQDHNLEVTATHGKHAARGVCLLTDYKKATNHSANKMEIKS